MSAADPHRAHLLYAEGVKQWNAGAESEAVTLIDAALAESPDFPEALCMGGYILGKRGKKEAALNFYRRALQLRENLALAWSNSGKLLHELENYEEALVAFDRALELRPDDARAWNDKACVLRHLGRHRDSLAAGERAIFLAPDSAEAHLNYGTALYKLNQPEEALSSYRRAEELKPNLNEAICGAALALRSLDRLDEAYAEFERAERLGCWDAISGKGCMQLLQGDFENGWEGYEARWIAGKTLAEALGARQPQWNGDLIPGLRVLVINDHGLGDTIQFSRYLLLMTQAGLKVTFLAPQKVHRLLSAIPQIRFTDTLLDEVFDAQIALSSLPRAFKTRLHNIPAHTPYLYPEPELQKAWAERLGASGFKIGIVWQGNPNPEADIARSMPLLSFEPIARVPGVRLISLQKGFGSEQIDVLPSHMKVETPAGEFDDGPDAFVDTAAIMANLDLIITCDTSIAHLAGALGRPVWVALKLDAEWRWLRNRDDSPWYPTMRLFRQRVRGKWTDVFAEMAELLGKQSHTAANSSVCAPVSVGELIDKMTILEIKRERIHDLTKVHNVETELAALRKVSEVCQLDRTDISALKTQLSDVNRNLWDIEDEIRRHEKRLDFGEQFIELARSVYKTNDIRARLKAEINRLTQSVLNEEKSYV